jgi:4,5-dihydroxyphthalate decarboxylase
MKVVGPDPLVFGLKVNAASIDALIQYAHQQRLIDERPARESVFVDI